ncbi:ubiquitin-associated domain-containing protein 1 isoform X1 [Anopheles bellator]|uniref:ubiquitin-associated domain-containing protein 1 isoform X1 n=1 Tax=Anopheles bellator TaxID=139047 RepID=UPI002649246B|nr:ubiquitin-associated domain-containing protein 1 isoform X1 [Anopheles bellator]
MIPWMREKFAERRARWQQSRKQPRAPGDCTSSCSSASSSSGAPSSEPSSGTPPATSGSPGHGRLHGLRNHRYGQRVIGTQIAQQSQQPSTSNSGSGGTSWRTRPSPDGANGETKAEQGAEQQITLRIISPRGGMVNVDVSRVLNGRQLKMHGLEKFASNAFTMPHFSSDLDKLADRYRLIRSHNKRIFRDDDLLLYVHDDEEFLLIAKRIDKPHVEDITKGPSVADILAATRHIPLSRINQASVNFNLGMVQADELQQDLRRIIISLSKASAYILGTGTCAEKLIALFQQRLINRKRHQISSIETLLEMGFSLDKINQALQITKNVFPAALDWLIQNDSSAKLFNCDKSASCASTSTTTNQTHLPVGTQESGNSNNGKNSDTSNESRSLSTSSSIRDSIDEPEERDEDAFDGDSEGEIGGSKEKYPFKTKRDNIVTLLEIVRLYSEKSVVPASDLLATMMEMGFEEESVREALIATHNNQTAACEWLLGNRAKSVQGLNDGLPMESPILRVLMESPQVQVSLGNPKMFIALITMLENSSTMTMWLSDNDTSSVLGHILRTYHEEKHILAINQYSNAPQNSFSQR